MATFSQHDTHGAGPRGRRNHPDWDFDALLALTEALWRREAFELRIAPRAARLSGATWREATRKLPARVQQRLRAQRQ